MHHGAREEGRERELVAGGLLELRLHVLAQFHDAGHVHFKDAMHVRAGALRYHHALGDFLAHDRHGHHLAGGHAGHRLQRRDGRRHRRRRGGGRGSRRRFDRNSRLGSASAMFGDERLNVVLGDAPAKARSRNLCQVNLVFLGNAAHQRAGAQALLLATFGILKHFALLFSLHPGLLIR